MQNTNKVKVINIVIINLTVNLKEDNNLYVFSNITNLYARSDNKTFLDNAAVFGMNLKNMKKCLRGVK